MILSELCGSDDIEEFKKGDREWVEVGLIGDMRRETIAGVSRSLSAAWDLLSDNGPMIFVVPEKSRRKSQEIES
jgi:hypothetical protein